MLSFCGQYKGSIDSNGRVKLSPKTITDFKNRCSGEVVMHCLPEGGLAVYPEDVYISMRSAEQNPAEKAGNSMLFRRNLRRFGALSSSERLSAQGRLTIPSGFRKQLDLEPGNEIYIVGVEIGVEIWSAARWESELAKINSHASEKGEMEMEADLQQENIS